MCDGSAYIDNCGICSEGTTGYIADSDMDCSGNCFGELVFDECGECGGDGIDDGACDCDGNTYDCAGVCGGGSELLNYWYDADGDGLGSGTAFPYCGDFSLDGWVTNNDDTDDNCYSNTHDCAGVCDGSAYIDNCGVCDEILDNDCTQDCTGTWGGAALIDECGICEGPGAIYECGCSDILVDACDCDGNVEDCAGECGGSAVEDECGVCDGEGIIDDICDCDGNILDCAGECGGDGYVDCANECNGDAVEDQCGVCDDNPDNDCVQDCTGTWGGTALIDECGECEGVGPQYECSDGSIVCFETDCPEQILGDVNFDGIINILDIVQVINIIMQGGEYNQYADVTQDGIVNVLDIVTLVNWVLGDDTVLNIHINQFHK